MIHTNRRLMELAVKNAQRVASEQFIEGLTEDFKVRFRRADCVYYPELSSLLAPVVSRANQEQTKSDSCESTALTSVSSSWDTAWKHFQEWTSRLPAGAYILVIGGGHGQTFDDTASWVSTLPGYTVSSLDIRDSVAGLPGLWGTELLVSSRDGDHAVVLDSYSGFLPEEPSPYEMVFETTAWGLG